MPFVTSAGAKVHFFDSEGTGPAVVLGHAFLMDHEMFANQVAALAPKYRVISIDARGHGLTEHDDSAFSFWDLARDAWAVLDRLGIDRVVVGGAGQGGFTALRMALLCPPRVDGLVLLGCSARAYSEVQHIGYRQVTDAWTGTAPLAAIAKMVAGLVIGGDRADHQPWLAKWLSGDRERVVAAADCLVNVDDITDLLGDIACPALLVRGAADPAFDHDTMDALAQGLGGRAEFHTVEGAAHTPNLTHAHEIDRLLLEFLGRIGR
ncbi:alpha/beta fold hydrolase [Nocardia sp. CA-129566]|uniref:alpha/beta fold hydrolase n=1 Tax=Nocardia sp. CA-129566 TaxID=3239976 RepID=UPI003D999FCF